MARRRDYTDITNAKPGSGSKLVDDLYNRGGRETAGFPRNQPPRPRVDPAVNDHVKRQGQCDPWKGDEVFNENTNQHPANWHDKNYNNDVPIDSWLRNGNAATKPGFDKHQNAWRSESKGNTFGKETIKDYEADHNLHHSEFELKHNAGVTHSPDAHDFSKRHVPSYEKRGELGLDKPDSNPKARR